MSDITNKPPDKPEGKRDESTGDGVSRDLGGRLLSGADGHRNGAETKASLVDPIASKFGQHGDTSGTSRTDRLLLKTADIYPTASDATRRASADGATVTTPEPKKELPPDYTRRLQEYEAARNRNDEEYWGPLNAIKQREGNNRSTFVYLQPEKEPEKPKLPTGFDTPVVGDQPAKKNPYPSINDFRASSKSLLRMAYGDSSKPDFELSSTDEPNFKQRYEAEALRIGARFNAPPGSNAKPITDETMHQIVRTTYAIATSGRGNYDSLSNTPEALRVPDASGGANKDALYSYHPEGVGASTALGYNQLLTANTLDNVRQQPGAIAARLEEMAKGETSRARIDELNEKAAMVRALGPVVQAELMAMAKTKPGEYLDDGDVSDQLVTDFARSEEPTAMGISRADFARAVHSLNLEPDIGPVLQGRELDRLMNVAKKKDFPTLVDRWAASYKSASDEYDGLSPAEKASAVQALLSRVTTTSTDPAQQREHAVTKGAVENKLLNLASGVDPGLSRDSGQLSQSDSRLIQNILSVRRNERDNELPPNAQLLLDKTFDSYYGGITGDKLMPAAIALANRAGATGATRILEHPEARNMATSNIFGPKGIRNDPEIQQRTVGELLMQIYAAQHGENTDPNLRRGIREFDAAFTQLTGKQP